jgi:uncharacterized RDD family membrane protein YckC/cytoskeletal protein CcmA (bactofilin family)
MKNTFRWLLSCVLLACLCGCALPAQAQDSGASTSQSARQIVSVGHASELPAGESAEEVVSVFGTSRADGNVSDDVVAVVGDLSVSGTVGGDAVAVLGDAYINGKVNGDVVSVLGNVKLGPQAVVGGQVTEVLGTLQRDPNAVVQGGTVHVLSGLFGNIEGLHDWFRDCLFYGRPLAPSLDVAWAWWLALAVLAFYILIAAIFQDGVRRCVQTLEMHPGPSLLSTVLLVLLVPVVMLALVITVVGIAVIPLFWIGVMCLGLFGRVVALGWLGARCLRLARSGSGSASQPVLDVLVGGLIVLALYMIPVFGFFLYVLLGVFGFGAVLYTILLAIRSAPAKPTTGGTRAGGGRTGPATTWSASGTAAGTTWTATGTSPETTGTADTTGTTDATAAASTAHAAAAGSADDASIGSPPPPPPPPPSGASGPAAAPDVLDVATLPRAGFWIRMLALLIDLILIGFAMHLLDRHSDGTLLVLAIYAAIMWKLKGTTVGGIVCDLKVVRIGGGPLDWGTATIRALGCFLSLVIAGLGFIWIAIDHEHQAWHDKIAGTVVVRVPKGVGLI